MENESQEPDKRRLIRKAAQEILSLHFDDPANQSRIAVLATKANEGQLTDEECAEYESFVDLEDLIAVLQALRTIDSGPRFLIRLGERTPCVSMVGQRRPDPFVFDRK